MKRSGAALQDASPTSSKRSKTACTKSELYFADGLPPPLTVTLGCKKSEYELTPAFDTFWRFAAERHAINEKRRAGHPPPWTTDPVLENYRFCNTFRVLDRVSQYIIAEVVEKGPQHREEVIFRILLFSIYTSIHTYEALRDNIKPFTWKAYNRDKYEGVLRDLYDRRIAIYTGAYQKPAPELGFAENFMNHLAFLEVLMNEVPDQLREAKYMADVFEHLQTFKSMGDFTAYQLILNLSYSNAMNFSEHDFVVMGVGSRKGLQRCFRNALPRAVEVDIVRWMQMTQNEHFERLGITFNGLGPDHLPMALCDIEHTLCELDKYIRNCTNKPTARRFVPTGELGKIRLPKAWWHKSRGVVRIKSQEEADAEVLEKFIVESITAHRVVNGVREFHVFWEGYTEDDATWEPEDSLIEDVPDAIRQYLRSIKGKNR